MNRNYWIIYPSLTHTIIVVETKDDKTVGDIVATVNGIIVSITPLIDREVMFCRGSTPVIRQALNDGGFRELPVPSLF